MAACAAKGGCPSDYVSFSISVVCFILLLAKVIAPYRGHKIARPKGRNLWLIAIQVFASFNLLLSTVMALGFFRIRRRNWWNSCYIWAVWVEGPLGFGLLLSCRILQAFQLYNIFVKRRLPPIRLCLFISLALLPWIASAAFINIEKPLSNRCHFGIQYIIPDLWRGILVSTCCIGLWVVSYVLNETHESNALLQIISRSVLLLMTSVLVLAFFTTSISQPLVSLMSMREKNHPVSGMMGWALGIPDSGLLVDRELTHLVNPSVPLDKLLMNRRFRRSYMDFADSCMAGESVHFYEEVQQLDKIPVTDHVRRIYMARHIIDHYITPGAAMEVNISHRCRQEILSTPDLAHPNLFKNALNELIQLMKMNMANNYWSSTFYMKLKEEIRMKAFEHELEHNGWSFSNRLSSIHCVDDPFHHEHSPRKSGSSIRDLEPQ
ncbi:Regulator of G-protein signaling 1 [Striga hermonthica]|uniref:Regulator of G-protein signaling 1 n=1 Tax=Striga hermonthica TaxID=68872 RepID=A0A9N7MYY5_STRHE|nr:Regulator of G-protein signaling 1 [Striga hermonthica]